MNQFLDLQRLPLHFLWQSFFSFQLVENINGNNLVKIFKSERIFCKISVSKKFGRGTLSIVRNSETGMSQTQEIKPFPQKMNATVLILVWLQN